MLFGQLVETGARRTSAVLLNDADMRRPIDSREVSIHL